MHRERPLPWREGPGCVIVRVRVTPKSSLDAIEGIAVTADGPALKARVRAAPSEGEANGALERLVARWLDVPKTRVTVTAGTRSRVKTLEITGDAGELVCRLERNLGRRPAGPKGAQTTSRE
jgi:hypothetical protein